MVSINLAQETHHQAIWEIFHNIVKSGDTYVYDPDTTKEEALSLWCNKPAITYVALYNNEVMGTYIIKPNFPGLGSHIANCSYMVSDKARGLGIGKAMAKHSIELAKKLGFIGMQFNIVVSTNENAVNLWKSLGFEIIGATPKGFKHKELGYVDSYIMYKSLL